MTTIRRHANGSSDEGVPLAKGSLVEKPLEFPWPEEENSGTKQRKERQASGWVDWLGFLLPCVHWLRTYRVKEYLLLDVLAGIAVGFTVVPQSMSYAGIAGVPAVYGLYGAFLPVFTYSIFGSCKQLGVGPVAVTSGLIYSGLNRVIPGYTGITDANDPTPEQAPIQAAYNHTVIQLAFVVACMYTAVGVLRLGFLIRFMSHPVLTGFTSGAALWIASGQVKYILGNSYPKQDNLQGEWTQIIRQLQAGNFVWQEFVMGLSMIILLVALKYASIKWPRLFFLKALGPFFACVIGIAVVAAKGYQNLTKSPIKIVKNIPQGMPHFTVGQWAPVDNLDKVLPVAFIVMAVDLLESTSIARALARKNGYELRYNQEIVALGIANFVGAAFNSYTTTGSFSRSAVNNSCGAKTQLSGFITSMIVMCVLLFLTPIFRLMPYNTMAAIIIVGVLQLVEIPIGVDLFRVHVRDFLVWLCAFIATCFAGIELGLAVSLGLSLIVIIFETAFPHAALLGRVQKTSVYRDVDRYPGAELVPGIVAVRLDAPVYFANVMHFENKIKDFVEDGHSFAHNHGVDGVQFLVVDLGPCVRIDSQGAHMIHDLAGQYKKKGIEMVLVNPHSKVARLLQRVRIHDVVPSEAIFVRTYDAVQYCKAKLATAEGGEGGHYDVIKSEYILYGLDGKPSLT